MRRKGHPHLNELGLLHCTYRHVSAYQKAPSFASKGHSLTGFRYPCPHISPTGVWEQAQNCLSAILSLQKPNFNGATCNLWMPEGDTVFNRQIVDDRQSIRLRGPLVSLFSPNPPKI